MTADPAYRDEVLGVCDALAAEGGDDAVTVRAVRERVGCGSMTTVHALVREWRRLRAPAAPPQPGGDVSMLRLLELVAEQERRRHEERLAGVRAELDEARREVSSLLRQMDAYAADLAAARRVAATSGCERAWWDRVREAARVLKGLPCGIELRGDDEDSPDRCEEVGRPGRDIVASGRAARDAERVAQWIEGWAATTPWGGGVDPDGEAERMPVYLAGVQIGSALLADPHALLPLVVHMASRHLGEKDVRCVLSPSEEGPLGYVVTEFAVRDWTRFAAALALAFAELVDRPSREVAVDRAVIAFQEWLEAHGRDTGRFDDLDVKVAIMMIDAASPPILGRAAAPAEPTTGSAP